MVIDKKQIFLTKFLGEPLRIILVKKIENPTSPFWQEDFLRYWPYMGMAASWVMWPNFFLTIFFFRDVGMLHMKFGWNWLNGLGEYDLLRYAKNLNIEIKGIFACFEEIPPFSQNWQDIID